MASNPPVKSVDTAFEIIELVIEREQITLSSLSEELDLPKSTVHDHLTTLKQRGYIGKAGQKYKANLKFLELGGRVRSNIKLFNLSESELQKISNETGEHASLMIEESDYGIYVYTAPGEYLQQVVVPIGTHTPLYVSAPGKAIFAHLPIARQRSLLEKYPLKQITENTITDVDEFREVLENIRERGYATDNEEGMRGLQGIAKPLISREDETVLGAISVYAPSGRANMEFLREEALKSLERAANVIGHGIYRGSSDSL